LLIGVSRGVVSKRKGRRGFWQGDGLGLLLSLVSNYETTRRKSLPRFIRAAEREGERAG
jgi:hypothetical protein